MHLSLSTSLYSFPAPAQRPKVPTVGVLVVGSAASKRFWQLFREDMRKLGYVEGKNVRYEFRSDEGQSSRLPALAAELVHLKVDLIVAWFTPAALAARQVTCDIPIVMALVGNPLETGLIQSLARPGGNVTGMAAIGGELAGKCVDMIEELVALARRIAALRRPRTLAVLVRRKHRMLESERERCEATALVIRVDWVGTHHFQFTTTSGHSQHPLEYLKRA